MEQSNDSKYSIEVYTDADQLIAELSGRAMQRDIHVIRNGSYSAEWHLDMDNLTKYAKTINTPSNSILTAGKSRIIIKRLGVPLFGGRLIYAEGNVAEKKDMDLKVMGWFDLLQYRFTSISRTFTATDAGAMAWTLIQENQALTHGDLGITEGNIATSVNRDRVWEFKKIRDAIIELSAVESGFDFEITPQKVFNVFYPSMGIKQDGYEFVYPGNIQSFKISDDANQLLNYAIVRGQGFGGGQELDVLEDSASEIEFGIMQNVLDFSDVPDITTLDSLGNEQINIYKKPVRILELVLSPNSLPIVGSYWLGDQVKVRIETIDYYEDVNAYFRIDDIEIKIDENDSEAVTLKLTSI